MPYPAATVDLALPGHQRRPLEGAREASRGWAHLVCSEGELNMGAPGLVATLVAELGGGDEDARVRRAAGEQRVAHCGGPGYGQLAQAFVVIEARPSK